MRMSALKDFSHKDDGRDEQGLGSHFINSKAKPEVIGQQAPRFGHREVG